MTSVTYKKVLQINCLQIHCISRLLLLVLLCVICIDLKAEVFETSSDYEKLTNQTIIASGNIAEFSRESEPLYSRLSLDRKKEIVYRVSHFCFASIEDISNKAGLLLIDKYSTVSIAILSTPYSSINVSITNVTLLDCEEVIKRESENIEQDFKNFQQEVEMQRKKNEAMIELLKKQQSLKRPRKKY